MAWAHLRSWWERRRWQRAWMQGIVGQYVGKHSTAEVTEVWQKQRKKALTEGNLVRVGELDAAWRQAYVQCPMATATFPMEVCTLWLAQPDTAWADWWRAWGRRKPGPAARFASWTFVPTEAGSAFHPFTSFESTMYLLGFHADHLALRERAVSCWSRHPDILDAWTQGQNWMLVLWPSWQEAMWRHALTKDPHWMRPRRHDVLTHLWLPQPDHVLFWQGWENAWASEHSVLLVTLLDALDKANENDGGETHLLRYRLAWEWLVTHAPGSMWDHDQAVSQERIEHSLRQAARQQVSAQDVAGELLAKLQAAWMDACLAPAGPAAPRRRL